MCRWSASTPSRVVEARKAPDRGTAERRESDDTPAAHGALRGAALCPTCSPTTAAATQELGYNMQPRPPPSSTCTRVASACHRATDRRKASPRAPQGRRQVVHHHARRPRPGRAAQAAGAWVNASCDARASVPAAVADSGYVWGGLLRGWWWPEMAAQHLYSQHITSKQVQGSEVGRPADLHRHCTLGATTVLARPGHMCPAVARGRASAGRGGLAMPWWCRPRPQVQLQGGGGGAGRLT